ncbi:MAG: hypothetical protein AB2411_12760 [Mesobacillus sp.]
MKNPKGRIFHNQFFLAVGKPPRRYKRLRGLPMTCSSRRTLISFLEPAHARWKYVSSFGGVFAPSTTINRI